MLNKKSVDGSEVDESPSFDEALNPPTEGEKLFLPYTGNGYIGVSANSKIGLFAAHMKSLSLPLLYNPLASIYVDNLEKKEVYAVEINNGIVHRIQCYQNENQDIISVSSTIYAHRTRPSLLIEEITFNNPTKDSFTFDVLQMGAKNWNQSKIITENINSMEFTINSGVIDVLVDNKLKHLCLSIGSTVLPTNIRLKEHDFNSKYYSITVVKYSTTYLAGKIENLEPVLNSLNSQVIQEIRDATGLGFTRLKKDHIQAWNDIWLSGFGISVSLASGALNGDQINSTIYYVLCNSRAPLFEVASTSTTNQSSTQAVSYHVERCYEGFSTLHAIKLWRLPLNETEASALHALWLLTLQKHGCRALTEIGVYGLLQAIVLSIGGFKFTHHHLDLNLNPRQLHRDYYFRRINYANLSLISVEVVVDSDNHAKLYATLNQLIDSSQKFWACDAGCIDKPVQLELNERKEFPVKLTNPPTSILYISSDQVHIDELKHTLHVQEVDIAPPQDVNSIAIHKHGHHMAGLATLFWTLFVILIIIFHLFLCKLVYRELCGNSAMNAAEGSGRNSYSSNYNKKLRYARTV